MFTNIDTFAVQLYPYVLMHMHIKGVPFTLLNEDDLCRLGYILIAVIVQ